MPEVKTNPGLLIKCFRKENRRKIATIPKENRLNIAKRMSH